MATADIETIELFFAHTLVPLLVMLLVPTALLIGLAVVAWPRRPPARIGLMTYRDFKRRLTPAPREHTTGILCGLI